MGPILQSALRGVFVALIAAKHRTAPSYLSCFLLGVLGAGCSLEHYARRADISVERELSKGAERTLGRRREEVLYPEPESEEPGASSGSSEPALLPGEGDLWKRYGEPRVLTIADALEIAVHTNRDYTFRLEGLYLSALSLVDQRDVFLPQLTTALNYLFADANLAPWAHGADLSATVTQNLPWGGNLTLNGVSSLDDSNDADATYSTSASIRLTQPLLRGAGVEPTIENLVQAERSLIYAIRDFELFREDFSIDVARRFYDLVQQKQSIENVRQNLLGFEFALAQADALYKVGRTSNLDVLRAKRNQLTAKSDLIEAVEGYRLVRDRFKVFLGLPVEAAIEIDPSSPTLELLDYELDSAIEIALANRLDLKNRTEQLEDARRAVRNSANRLLPDLGLSFDYNTSGGPDANFGDQTFETDSYSVGLSLVLPDDRLNERNAYRRAQIAQARAERDLVQFRDNLVIGIQGSFRELKRRKQTLDIQNELIVDQQKNLKIAQLRFEQGEVGNRDVVEAQQSLLDARNRLIREKVNYEISRLILLRNLGILFIDDKGMWTE